MRELSQAINKSTIITMWTLTATTIIKHTFSKLNTHLQFVFSSTFYIHNRYRYKCLFVFFFF